MVELVNLCGIPVRILFEKFNRELRLTCKLNRRHGRGKRLFQKCYVHDGCATNCGTTVHLNRPQVFSRVQTLNKLI